MTRLYTFVFAAGLMLPAMACAATPLDGTWKADMSTASFSGKPLVILVRKGVYACTSCVPAEHFKADGQPHPTKGSPYHDTGSATIVSPNEVDVSYSKSGKVVTTQAITVSDDGMTATFKGTDSSATNAAPVVFNYQAKRVGKAPKGALAVSGKWLATAGNSSDNALIITYKTSGDTLTMSNPTGQSYTVTIGGKQAPYLGDPGTTSVAVTKINDHSFKETDYRHGKVIGVFVTTVAADGKTAKVVSDFPMNGQHTEFTQNKV
jgi:hypothetical protein